MTVITDKLEVDCALMLRRPPPPPPPSINAPFQWYSKLVKATQKGENMKQGCNITGNRTRVLAHQRPTPSALTTIVIIIFIIIIFVSLGFTIIIIITSEL